MLSSRQANTAKESAIDESYAIRDILELCSYDSCVILDFDNTLAESSTSLGSDSWFEKLLDYANQQIKDQQKARSLVITLCDAVQHHVSMQAVELKTARIVKILQDIHIPVLLVTARGPDVIEPTLRQLKEINIDFSKHWPENNFRLNVDNKVDVPIYYNGKIFCNGNDKAKCIKAFFDFINYHPRHVVMTDDRKNHLIRTKEMIEQNGGRFHGLRYGKLDEKVEKFDMQEATNQLFEIYENLSIPAQQAAEQLNLTALVQNSVFAYKAKPTERENIESDKNQWRAQPGSRPIST
jgi:hypothetical protein